VIILQARCLEKSYGIQHLFHNVSFSLEEGEKVGLIGPNGTGKSTLLKCLTGEEVPDAGDIFVNERTTIGYLAQNNLWHKGTLFEELLMGFASTVEDRQQLRNLERLMAKAQGKQLEEFMAEYALVTERYERAGGYACEAMVKRVAKGLGFADHEFIQPVRTMSGGQKTRAALARVLLAQPDILLLDEPTNHLDINALEWLEEFLNQYPKTVLLVSHDRYFLDRTVSRILELENGRISSFNENYQGYLRRKGENEESYRRAYRKQQQAIAKTEEFIRRYRAGIKAKQARGRETLLAKMDRLEKLPPKRVISPRTLVPIPESGHMVLEIKHLGHGFSEKKLFSQLEFTVTRGEKVALVGGNGTGKSTILKALVGEIAPEEGDIKLGARVKISYFSQEHENLNWDNTVLQEIISSINKSEEESRGLLAAFLFGEDDWEKKIGDLSGGERSRLALLKLLLTGANFLVLDEPTNHLDIPSKEMVEDFLGDFPGTLLVVSHDRYFLDKTADRVLELENGRLTDYPGNYTYYRFKKKENNLQDEKKSIRPKDVTRNHYDFKENERALKKLAKEIEGIEMTLEALEQEKAEIEQAMSNPACYGEGSDIKKLVSRYHDLEEKITLIYVEWERLLEEQERIL